MSVLAAADLADLDAVLDRSVLLAAEAAALPLTFLLPDWARALAAADLAGLDAVLDRSVLLAALATFLLVCSLRAFDAMGLFPSVLEQAVISLSWLVADCGRDLGFVCDVEPAQYGIRGLDVRVERVNFGGDDRCEEREVEGCSR